MITLKKALLVLIAISVFFSCRKDDNYRSDPCVYRTEILAPEGYILNEIGSIGFSGHVESFQFVTPQTGFALASKMAGGFVEVFKTTDGGQTWSNLEINIDQHPKNMIFKDENLGIITVQDVTGCPHNCQHKCVILKTENGGSDWEEIDLEDLQGILYHPAFDSDGNLYAYLKGVDRYALMRSADNGSTWDTLFTSPDMFFELVTFSFWISEDRIHISAKDGNIIVTDLNGKYLKTLEIGDPSIWDLGIIDEDNLVAVISERIIKSSDGGETWSTIQEKGGRLIGFGSAEKGLFILGKSFCHKGSGFQSNDLIAYTTDGGQSWVEAEETTTNLRVGFVNSQKMGDGTWYIMTGKTLMELKETGAGASASGQLLSTTPR